jgi:hypothetical protein
MIFETSNGKERLSFSCGPSTFTPEVPIPPIKGRKCPVCRRGLEKLRRKAWALIRVNFSLSSVPL